MPWCDGCDRFYKPGSLAPDGTCVQCGEFIARPQDEPDEEASKRAPWHFYALIIAVVVYLGWRLVQGIAWVVHRYL